MPGLDMRSQAVKDERLLGPCMIVGNMPTGSFIAASRVLVFLVGDSYCDSLEIIYTTRN
jgi:hypothetical protein